MEVLMETTEISDSPKKSIKKLTTPFRNVSGITINLILKHGFSVSEDAEESELGKYFE